MAVKQVGRVAVIGLGTMGCGLVQVFAQAGYEVVGYDSNAAALPVSKRIIESIFETMVEFNEISADEARASLLNLEMAESLEEAFRDADLIVEAITEEPGLKRELFHRIGEILKSPAMLWSNTSSLNIYELVPDRLQKDTLIAHWFAPPYIIPLVELVRGPYTPDEIVDFAVVLLKSLNKVPIVLKKYVPGFAINRIQRIMGREIFFLLEEGYITAQELDLAVRTSLAPRMMVLGAVQRYDFTGLDLSARNLLDGKFFDPPINNKPSSLHSRLARGELGVKTGKGFYDYGGRDITEVIKDRDRHLLRVFKELDFCLKADRLV